MRRVWYLAAECLLVWAFIVAIQLGFLYFLTDFGGLIQLLAIVFAAMALPLAARMVLMQAGNSSWKWGIYNPVRPIAALRQSGLFESEDAGKLRFDFTFEDSGGRDSIDIVGLLAGELERQGIQHANVGFLRVKDGGSHWVVEPSLNEPRISGWVQADSATDRQQVVRGIRDFLTGTSGIQLSEAGR